MFRKVLIANRGEIAVRILRASRELDIPCVAVYSTADKTALHAQISDEAVCIGPPESRKSYLDINSVIQAALQTGCDALHPGFGFLSENAEFARKCAENGITFIGPSSEAIEMLGDKAQAKTTMKNAGVPVIPGSDGAVTSYAEAKKLAEEIGYPVLVKASAGGGGRGIRLVENAESLESQITAAKQEALNFFGNDEIYLEKFIVCPRHIEIQIAADMHGNVIHLFERDCSMQRRNQKILEEAPSVAVTPELREAMGSAAIKAAKAAKYHNVGTIEFLLDNTGKFYFMEMNTRIQVEHPVTEKITGIDLVKMQFDIAAGKPLQFKQEDIRIKGHAIECRINAEDPAHNFRPSPGRINALHVPGGPGVRIDSAVYQGYTIPANYDSMIAKLIVHAETRQAAIKKMKWALAEFLVEGVKTNIDFQMGLIKNPDFEKGEYDIGFLARQAKQ
jgi:acetyl-CoA carboxylase biotin carboxylase subunit